MEGGREGGRGEGEKQKRRKTGRTREEGMKDRRERGLEGGVLREKERDREERQRERDKERTHLPLQFLGHSLLIQLALTAKVGPIHLQRGKRELRRDSRGPRGGER